jgi:GT2 family glycosyltransferase
VPAYNRADLLPEALGSVLRQTYENWRVVVVDDASSDDTYAVARRFADRRPERITVLRLAENVGVGAARTIGIDASGESELVCLLDHDDALLEDYLSRLVGVYDARIAAGGRPGIVSCDALVLGPRGLTGERCFGPHQVVDPIDLDTMIARNCISARAIFSRAAYDDAGGAFAPECLGSDDYDLWLRILEAGYEAVMIPEPLAVYREHPESYSWNRIARADGAVAAYRRALARGALTPRQRRSAKRQILHYRASREWELLRRAVMAGRRREATRLAVRGVPLAIAAFAQRPSRWRDWATGMLQAIKARRPASEPGARTRHERLR